ncbi:MAG TPA: BamA/TamA family outer membrane protein [Polyangiaceae bacterium]|nr:BamA/TamA family outer membrane protein [Polyangiaceae bacterium]
MTLVGLAAGYWGIPAAHGTERQSEFTAVPFVGGDSDMGWGGGALASWARLSPGLEPYRLRVEAATALTVRRDGEDVELPYTDAYLLFEAPHALPHRLKLRARLSYTRETRLKYYGLGNAAEPAGEPTLYGRTHPTLDVQAEYRVTEAVRVIWGVNYTQNWLKVAEDSQLGRDMVQGSTEVREILGRAKDHAVVSFSYGLTFDTRDDIVNPQTGVLAAARVDLAPGGSGALVHRYARLNTSVRGFLTLMPNRLVLAARVVGDLLSDGAPFYELGRYDQTSAIGGIQGVRGVPAQRYIGKLKVFGNLELRSHLFAARLFQKSTRFGLTGFVDTGRVWSDYQSHPELDGSAIGLKLGLGGGLRVSAGKSFVLRFDVGWAKEAEPIAAYLTSGHAF